MYDLPELITSIFKQLRDKNQYVIVVQSLSCVQLFATPRTVACQAPLSMGFPSKNTGVSSHFPLGGLFPTQGLNLCLLHRQAGSLLLCAQSLSRFRLSATPWTAALQAPMSMGILQAKILEWLAISFSRASSQAKDQTQVSHIAGIFFND